MSQVEQRLHRLGLVLPALLVLANMARVRSFTIDDSFISYRYARNLARGLGLVYNAGERIEGYTNFLFTVLLAGGIKLGIDESHRRHRLSYKIKQRTRRLQAFFGLT